MTSKPFTVTTGLRTLAQVAAAAATLEACLGEIANGKRKASQLPMEELIVLIQHAKNTTK